MELDELCLSIGNKLLFSGANDVEIMKVEERTKLTKRVIICTAPDNQESKKLATLIKEEFKNEIDCLHTDGIIKGDWIIVDYKDIIVHIFTKETRQKYNIEKLYKDANNTYVLPKNNI